MAEGIRIRVVDQPVIDYLQRLRGRLTDMRPVFEAIGAVLQHEIELRFLRKQDPSGQAWAPWAPATVKAYARADTRPARGGGTEVGRRGTLLQRSGTMLDSSAVDVGADQVEIGFGQPYAGYHELGTARMPRRGMLTANPETGELGADDQRSVLEVLEGYLSGGDEK